MYTGPVSNLLCSIGKGRSMEIINFMTLVKLMFFFEILLLLDYSLAKNRQNKHLIIMRKVLQISFILYSFNRDTCARANGESAFFYTLKLNSSPFIIYL